MKINPTRAVFGCFCVVGLMAANTTTNKLPYSPYQILVWELKANEGYRSTWYKDGNVRGRQSYSIGFGWNDQGNRRRHEIKHFLTDGKVSYDEATQITLMEINKYGRLHPDPLKNVALQLYSYSRGMTKDPRKLGRCCGGSKGCGNSNSNIRKSHNRRRAFELACWNHNYDAIIDLTDENKSKIKKILWLEKKKSHLLK